VALEDLFVREVSMVAEWDGSVDFSSFPEGSPDHSFKLAGAFGDTENRDLNGEKL
jgi:hypothetical protein